MKYLPVPWYSQLAFTCSKLTIETLDQDVRYIQKLTIKQKTSSDLTEKTLKRLLVHFINPLYPTAVFYYPLKTS